MNAEEEFRLTPPGPVEHPAAAYVEENLEDLWDAASGERGLWVRPSDIPDAIYHGMSYLLEGKVSEKRLEAIKKGEKPKKAELELWKQAWLDEALVEDVDADVIPGYLITEITIEDRAPVFALIMCTGYSFTHLEHWCEGIFDSVEEAKEYMLESGSIT